MLVDKIFVLALDVDGVLTDGKVTFNASGDEVKQLAFRDLDALTKLRTMGIRIALVTGEDNLLVDAIAKRIGADFVFAGSKNKALALKRLAKRAGVALREVAFVGDAERDAAAFPMVGLSFAPSDASLAARRGATRVLAAEGGRGAVEEAAQFVLGLLEEGPVQLTQERELRRIVEDSIEAHRRLVSGSVGALSKVASLFTRTLRSGGKLMFCGNGGSAADAQHVAGELVGRFALESEPWPAISLCTDSSILTAVANDWEYEQVFARQVRALGRPGDVVIAISTSGNSKNTVRALEAARQVAAATVAFTGASGGALAKLADVHFAAPSEETPRIQELHILAWHAVSEIVEAALTQPAGIISNVAPADLRELA